MRNLPIFRTALIAATMVILPQFFAVAQDFRSTAVLDNPKMTFRRVRGNVYMLTGAGPAITVQASDESVAVVNTGLRPMGASVLAAIKQISPQSIRWVMNTNSREENTGGNAVLAEAGEPTTDFRGQAALASQESREAPIISQENAMLRMSGATQGEKARPDGVPFETFLTYTKLYNGEGIEIFHAPAATTDGDSFVFFRGSDVISAGDLYSTVHYPNIDLKRGGSINGVIDALTRIIELCIFRTQSQGGTYVLPGEGRISDQSDVTEYRDMLAIIRDRVQNAIEFGSTLPQIKAAQLARDYDPRYGSSDAFIETVYKSLTAKK